MLNQRRDKLWESALIDVTLTIKEEKGRLELKKLLTDDSPNLNSTQKKNVILISSLYHNLVDEIEESSISNFLDETILEDLFEDVITISIQKNTFETVANFLSDEILGL